MFSNVVYYTPVLDAKKLPYKIISIAIDISKLKEEEQKNLELLEKMNLSGKTTERGAKLKPEDSENDKLIESVELLFPKAELDATMNFIKINELFSEQFKFSLKELKGKPLTRIIVAKEDNDLYEKLDALRPGKIEQIEVEIGAKGKQTADYTLKIIPLGKESVEKTMEDLKNNKGILSKTIF